MKFEREPYEAMHIDMTPMVDAIFAIILFLLVASSIQEALEQDLSIALPSQGKEVKVKAPPTRPMVVNVRYLPGNKAEYHIANEVMSVPTLTSRLSRAKVMNKEQEVVIRGDRNVKWDQIAAVMSACAQAGITKVSATVEVRDAK